MISMFAQSRSLPVRANVLRSGQAPKVWKRELLQQTDRMVTVLRSSAWLKVLVAGHPAFLKQPLLGNCLSEITSNGPPPSDVTNTESSRGATHFNRTTPVSRDMNRKVAEWAGSALSRQMPRTDPVAAAVAADIIAEPAKGQGKRDMVSHLPPRVEGSLLKRFAGAVVEFSRDNERSAPRSLSLPRNRPRSSSPIVMSSHRHQHWRNLVAHRAAQKWLGDWPSSGQRVSDAGTFLNVPAENSAADASAPPLLGEQWVTPLIGPGTSREMLVQLVNLVGPEAMRRTSEVKRSTVKPTGNKSFTAPSNLPGQEISGPKSTSMNDSSPGFGGIHFEKIIRDRDQQLLIQQIDRDQPEHPFATPFATNERRSGDSLNFAPPALSGSLPPLLPTASPGAPALPLAADTARQGAWRDEVRAQEKDLNLLAAQIKRILDAEARRHGIDV